MQRADRTPRLRLVWLALALLIQSHLALRAQAQDDDPFIGMDESVNEALAEQAGRPGRDPLLDTESWGELWNLLLLGGGAICGFIVGRYWDQIWGRKPGAGGDGGSAGP